jgi:thiamine transport system substrate-binding protein
MGLKRFVMTVMFLSLLAAFGAGYLFYVRLGSTAGHKPTIRVFGYSSFTGSWGPGPILKAEFEKTCNCEVEYVESPDSGYILQRLKLEGPGGGGDLVIGIDQFDLATAMSAQQWRPITVSSDQIDPAIATTLPVGPLVAYDWGVMAFVTKKGELANVPRSLDDLLKPEFAKKVAIENPASSSPGRQFLRWIIQTKGPEGGAAYLKAFLQQVHSVTPGWTEAYGLLTKGIVATTLSYTTSPVYHQIEDKSDSYTALEFSDGHPVQIEFIGIPATCRSCEIAADFATYILSAAGQKLIMEKSYMFPIRTGVRIASPEFANVPSFKTLPMPGLDKDELAREQAIWEAARRGN